MPSKKVMPQRSAQARSNGREGAAARKYPNNSTKAGIALMNPDKPLTEQQALFVKLWAQGESIITASAKAGYGAHATYAYRLCRMPHILRIYQAEKLEYERAGDMNRKKVMDGFLEAIDMARMMADPTAMIAGWRDIAKMCGYFAPVEIKQTITHEGKIVLDRLNQMSDTELMKVIEERAAQIATHPQGASNAAITDQSQSRGAGARV